MSSSYGLKFVLEISECQIGEVLLVCGICRSSGSCVAFFVVLFSMSFGQVLLLCGVVMLGLITLSRA